MTDGFSGAQGRLGPGSRVAGYVIEEQVGAGGMAIVYRARDEVLGRAVALKVMSPSLAADAEFQTRFLRESRAVAAVDDPHIVPVYAAGESGGLLYLATRFVAGGDLAALAARSGGRLEPGRAAAFISQVASALDAAHAAGLVHRDVKLANVLVDSVPGKSEHAYLSDFGLTKNASGATGLTATGMFMGTPDYCAPEQVVGGQVDSRSDQYALGCAAFTLLTGSLPYQRPQPVATLFAHVNDPVPVPSAVRPDLSRAVDAVIGRAMAKDPAARYASCGEFAAALESAVAGRAGVSDGYEPTQLARPRQGAGSVPPGPVSPAYPNPVLPSSVPPGPVPPSPISSPPWQGVPPAAPVPSAYSPAAGMPQVASSPQGYQQAGYPQAGYQQPGYQQPGSYPPAPAPQPGSYPPAPGYQAPGYQAPGSQPPGYQAAGYQAPGYQAAGYQAPGYAQAPGYSQPGAYAPAPGPAKGKGKGKAVLIGTSVGVLVLAAAGVGAAVALSGGSKPTFTTATLAMTISAPSGDDSYQAAFSPDGKRLASDEFNTSSADDSIVVYDLATGHSLQTLSVPTTDIVGSSVSFSSDGSAVTALCITSGNSFTSQVFRWSVSTGSRSLVYSLKSPVADWNTADQTTGLSGDGSTFVTPHAASGGSVDVRNIGTGASFTLSPPDTSSLVATQVSYSGSEVLIAYSDGSAFIYRGQQELGTLHFAYKAATKTTGATYPYLSEDGSHELSFSSSGALTLYDTSGNADTPTVAQWPSKAGVLFSDDGKYIVTDSNDKSFGLWTGSFSHVLSASLPGGGSSFPQVFSPDGSELLTVGDSSSGTQDGKLYIWHLH